MKKKIGSHIGRHSRKADESHALRLELGKDLCRISKVQVIAAFEQTV